ncbi:MAG: hypothetical protein MZV70_35340 [Desulfobacterales bacterium]|nr:hypothetical protein [Desulfobacterales bacterium]
MRSRNRYYLSHYHVRIDWPISDAAEDSGAQPALHFQRAVRKRGENRRGPSAQAVRILQPAVHVRRTPDGGDCGRAVPAPAARHHHGVCQQQRLRALIRICERGVAKLVAHEVSQDRIWSRSPPPTACRPTRSKNTMSWPGRAGNASAPFRRPTRSPPRRVRPRTGSCATSSRT